PVAVGGARYSDDATGESAAPAVAGGRSGPTLPGSGTDFEGYSHGGGYRLLRDCLDGKHAREDLIAALADSGLRGLGGAGFPAGQKWTLVRQEPGPRLLAVNADEGEPGTFKDRHYLETDPHRFLEGMLIAAWVVEAEESYIYLRDEYPEARAIL